MLNRIEYCYKQNISIKIKFIENRQSYFKCLRILYMIFVLLGETVLFSRVLWDLNFKLGVHHSGLSIAGRLVRLPHKLPVEGFFLLFVFAFVFLFLRCFYELTHFHGHVEFPANHVTSSRQSWACVCVCV